MKTENITIAKMLYGSVPHISESLLKSGIETVEELMEYISSYEGDEVDALVGIKGIGPAAANLILEKLTDEA